MIEAKEPVRSVRKSRREEFHAPVDQTNSTLNGGYVDYRGSNQSQPQATPQFYAGNIPQQSMPAVVLYTQPPPPTNIVLSNVQPPPLNDQTKKKCCT